MKGLVAELLAEWQAISWSVVFVTTIKIILLILLAYIAVRTGDAAINRILKEKDGDRLLPGQRLSTLRTLLRSLLRYGVYFIAFVTILNLLGVKVEAILAGAGVVGLAVGFGAQNLVRDIITGFFILFEDQFAVGDYITTANVSGTVEDMGLRITKLRDFSGELHILPNGIISQVTNHTRGSMRALVDIPVAYDENVDRVLEILRYLMEDIAKDMAGVITQGPDVLGVVAISPNSFTVRITTMTLPMEQWAVEREIRRRVKEVFEQEGIRAPHLPLPSYNTP